MERGVPNRRVGAPRTRAKQIQADLLSWSGLAMGQRASSPHLICRGSVSKAFFALSKSGQLSRLWRCAKVVLWVWSRRPSSVNVTSSNLFSKTTLFIAMSSLIGKASALNRPFKQYSAHASTGRRRTFSLLAKRGYGGAVSVRRLFFVRKTGRVR